MVHTCPGTSFSFLGSWGTLLNAAGLVVAGGVQGQVAEEFAVAGDDSNAQVVADKVAREDKIESALASAASPA
jgi:hypothetical protein